MAVSRYFLNGKQPGAISGVGRVGGGGGEVNRWPVTVCVGGVTAQKRAAPQLMLGGRLSMLGGRYRRHVTCSQKMCDRVWWEDLDAGSFYMLKIVPAVSSISLC